MRGTGPLALRLVLVTVILAAVNLLAQRFFVRADLTDEGLYSVSGSTTRVLDRLDDVVTVTVYFSRDLPPYLASLDREVKDFLDEYRARARGNLVVEFTDPADDPVTEQAVRALGIPRVQLNIMEADKAQVMAAYLGIAVQYGDETEVLPVVQGTNTLEYELTSAIVKVTGEPHTVGVAGPQGFSLESLQGLSSLLEGQYELTPVDPSAGPVPPEVETLILADHDGLTDEALYRVDQFVMGGGKLLVLAPSVTIPPQSLQGRDRQVRMETLLRNWGVLVRHALVVDAQSAMASFQQGYLSYTVPYPWWPQIPGQQLSADNPITAGLDALTLPWTSPLQTVAADSASGQAVEILAESSIRSFAKSAPYNLDPQNRMTLPAEGVEPQPVALALTGRFPSYWAGGAAVPGDSLRTAQPLAESPETRMVVVGSWQFLTDSFVQQFNGNAVFAANAVDWMTLGGDLIEIRSRAGGGRLLREVDDSERALLKVLGILAVPVLVVLAGLVRMRLRAIRRRRLAREYGGAA